MTKKEIFYEFIWLLFASLLSYSVIVLLLPPTYEEKIASIFLAGDLVENFAFKLRILISFLLLFPTLFLLISCRELFRKMRRKSQNIYLLFISAISMICSVICLNFFESITTMIYGSWKIYPPLSAYKDEFKPPENSEIYYNAFLAFLVLQTIVILILVWKVFGKNVNTK